MKTTITIDDIVSWGPCDAYQDADGKPCPELIRAAMGGASELPPAAFLDLDIPHLDRLWVVLREDVLSARDLRLFACSCAERALLREISSGRTPDDRSWYAIGVARMFAEGFATREDLAVAKVVGWAAAWAAAWAAVEAARAAAEAARGAAEAARAAAWAAAGAAAEAAERGSEERAQREHLGGIL